MNVLSVCYTGAVPLSTYMRIYKKGDIVDIKVSHRICASVADTII